jgi:hypothetical protein
VKPLGIPSFVGTIRGDERSRHATWVYMGVGVAIRGAAGLLPTTNKDCEYHIW